MILNFKNILTLLFLGFALGFSSTFLFSRHGKSHLSKKQATSTVKELRNNADSAQKSYLAKIENLENQNFELQQDLAVTQGLLDQAKEASRKRESKILKITEPQSLCRNRVEDEDDDSSAIAMTPTSCDSLVSEVMGYIDETHRKDTLYENQIQTLSNVVLVKDSIIKADEKLSSGLHQILDRSLKDQKTLQNENLHLEKQFRRWRNKSKIEKIGIVLLTATATYFLSHH